MLPNDNVSMFVAYLDHVLIVYSSMEHVTWKSPGPMCGWVCRILRSDSCMSASSWSKVPLLSIRSVAVPLCRVSTTFALSQSMAWFSSTAWSVMADLWVTLLSLALEARVCVPAVKESTSFLWFPGHVLHRAVNSRDVIKMSDGHRNVVVR